MPFTSSLIVGAVSGGLQAGLGLYQFIKGRNQEAQNVRPMYEIPEQIKKQLSSAELQALEGLPEQQRQNYIDQLLQQSQQAVSNAEDRRGGLASIATIADSQNQANKELLAMDAQARLNNEQALQNVRQNYAQYEDKQFQLNQLNPFYERATSAQAMKGAGLQNLMGAVQGVGQSIVNTNQDRAYLDAYKKMNQKPTAMQTNILNSVGNIGKLAGQQPQLPQAPVYQMDFNNLPTVPENYINQPYQDISPMSIPTMLQAPSYNPNYAQPQFNMPVGSQFMQNPFMQYYQQNIQASQNTTDPNLINPYNPFVQY